MVFARTLATAILIITSGNAGAADSEAKRAPVEYRCQELLTQVVLQPDRRKIAATIFHTLAVDYPVFFDERVNSALVTSFVVEFMKYPSLERLKGWKHEWGQIYHVKKDIDELMPKLRQSIAENQGRFDRVVERVWSDLRRDFVDTAALDQYARYPHIPREDFPDIKVIFQTIDTNEDLKRAFLSVLNEQLIEFSAWSGSASGGKEAFYVNRRKAIRAMSGVYEKDALPTGFAGKGHSGPPATAYVELKRLNEEFSRKIPPDFAFTHEAFVQFDFETRRAIQLFSSASATRLDYFREDAAWRPLYERAGAWLLAKSSPLESKTHFLAALNLAEEALDRYLRHAENERFTRRLAEVHVAERLDFLYGPAASGLPAVDSPLYGVLADAHAGAIRKFGEIMTDLKGLEFALGAHLKTLTDAQAILRSARSRAENALRIGESTEAAAAFRADLERLQSDLGLDPVLAKLLAKQTWGFWK